MNFKSHNGQLQTAQGRQFSRLSGVSTGLVPAGGAGFTISAAGAAVTLTFATLGAGKSYLLDGLEVGYDTAVATGKCEIRTAAGALLWSLPLTAAGMAPLALSDAATAEMTGITIALTAGGGAVLATINARPKVIGNT